VDDVVWSCVLYCFFSCSVHQGAEYFEVCSPARTAASSCYV